MALKLFRVKSTKSLRSLPKLTLPWSKNIWGYLRKLLILSQATSRFRRVELCSKFHWTVHTVVNLWSMHFSSLLKNASECIAKALGTWLMHRPSFSRNILDSSLMSSANESKAVYNELKFPQTTKDFWVCYLNPGIRTIPVSLSKSSLT